MRRISDSTLLTSKNVTLKNHKQEDEFYVTDHNHSS